MKTLIHLLKLASDGLTQVADDVEQAGYPTRADNVRKLAKDLKDAVKAQGKRKTPAPSFPTTLYVLIIDNDSGLTASIHRTKQGATDALFAYIKDNWNAERMGEIPKISAPQDQDVAIDAYFKDDSIQDVGERAQILPCKIED